LDCFKIWFIYMYHRWIKVRASVDLIVDGVIDRARLVLASDQSRLFFLRTGAWRISSVGIVYVTG
jgi:hypothetical protein